MVLLFRWNEMEDHEGITLLDTESPTVIQRYKFRTISRCNR